MDAIHAPQSFVGVVIAILVLAPESIAIASIWLDGPPVLGLGPTQMVLLALTAVVAG